MPPAETVERVRSMLPAMGITRLANVTGLDVVGLPVVMACRPNSRNLAVAQGKGLTLDAAKASAAMEAIESYHAESVRLPMLLGSHDELREERPVADVARLARLRTDAFAPGRRTLWVEGRDLIAGRAVWVPFDLVHLDLTYDIRAARGFEVSSTGLASGNHHLEAVGHALGELIERDAAARWLELDRPARDATRLALDTVDDASCRRAVDQVARAGFRLLVHDLTSVFGVAVFRCELLEDPRHAAPALCAAGGYGCHPDRAVALLRAVTEAAQSRLTLIAGSRDDMFRPDYQAARDRTLLDSRWQAADGDGTRRFTAVPTYHHETFDDEIAFLLDHLRGNGVTEVVVVDLTQPRFGLPVVRVLVPGLRTLPRPGAEP